MLGSPGAHVTTTQRTSRMVNHMAAQTNLVKTPVRAAMAVAVAVLALQAGQAAAAITQQAPWAQEFAGTTTYPAGTVDAAYAVAAGTGRLLVVAVSATRSAVGTITCSASYGGTAMTLAAGDGTVAVTWNHSFLFYMLDTPALMNGTGRALAVTCAGGTAYATWVYSAVYAGVDQTTPLTDARNYNSTSTASTAVGPFSPGLSIGANDQAIEIVNLARSSANVTPRTVNAWATGWATGGQAPASVVTSGPTATMYIRDRDVLTAATDGSQHTASSATTWDSMTAMAMKVGPTGTTTIGDGTPPASLTLAPGAPITDLDAFTLVGTAADTVTAATVTLTPTGAFNNIGQVTLTNDTGTSTYGTNSLLTGDVVTFTGMSLPVTTTLTNFHVRITPDTHAAMPAVPGAQYATQGVVSAFTSGNTQAGSNTAAGSATLTVDNLSPSEVTGLSATPGNTQLVVNWTNPATDYARTLVLYRATTAIADIPVEGTTTYIAGAFLGSSTIAFVGGTAGAASTTTITGLTNGTSYNIKVFVQDPQGNWSATGAIAAGTPTAPTVPPGAPGMPTYSGVTATSITANWTAATGAATYNVDVSTDGTTFSSATTGLATLAYTHAGRAANTQYWYRVTAVNVSGSAQGGSSSTWTLTNPVAAAPTSSGASTTTVTVNWTAPAPAATTYLVEWSLTNFGAVVGSTTVSATTATAGGLNPATAYYFRVTALNGAGVAASPSPVGGPFTTPSGPTLVVGDGTNPANVPLLCPSPTAPTGATNLDAFTLQATGTADVVTRITVQLAPAGAWINVATVEIRNSAGTTIGSAVPGGDQTNVYVGSLAIPTGAASTFSVWITPKTHAAMPPPNAGQQYPTTGTVVSVASNNPRAYGDTASATVTIDNLAPSEVAWSGVTTTSNSITLNWTTATKVVVLMKQGGPVTDAPVEETAYTAPGTIGASTIVCAGTTAIATCTTPATLTTGTAYYFEVFTVDACNNFSLGAVVGPLFPGGSNEGNPTANTLVPVVGILNPKNPATVTNTGVGFRVQVRAYSRTNAGGAAQPVTVRLKAATPAQTFTTNCGNATDYPIALPLNANYPSSAAGNIFGVYEANVIIAKGAYTLRACASNASGNVLSGPVGITVNDGTAGSPRGDGNLLVRDNGAQLCNDCHAIATHASETVGNSYGSWYAACRDCHTPHNTTNVELIRQQITPPAYRNQMAPRQVVFYDRTTGYAATAYANPAGTGVCQVCHTATNYYRSDGTLAGSHNPNQPCTACHAHDKGLKASCTTCHGAKGAYTPITGADSLAIAAPPTAADKVTTTGVKVGAHQAHVNGNTLVATYRTNPIGCADCHPIPNSHNGTTDAAWSVLATTTSINGTNLVVAPTPAAGSNAYNATWEATPTCTNACHGVNIPSNPTKPTPSWTAVGGLTCASCHGAPPALNSPSALQQNHPQNTNCAICHGAGYVNGGPLTAAAKATHINGTLNRITSGCTSCHGELGAPGVTLTANTVQAAPGATGSGTNSYDTTGVASGGNSIGAHKAHLIGSTGAPRWRQSAIACTDCHALPPLDTDITHATGAGTGNARATLTWSPLATGAAAGNYLRPTCSAVYCHDPKPADTAASQNNSPAWNAAPGTVVCGSCHGLPPTGTGHTTNTSCSTCHLGYANAPTAASTGTAVSMGNHINGKVDLYLKGDCTGCHNTAQGSRRTITQEFANAWSHKRSAAVSGNVIKWDCIVCHMEGDMATGDTADAYHANGVIDLRDPDTGNTIQGVNFVQATTTVPGSYSSTNTAVTFTQFSRNLGVTLEADPNAAVLQAIMINQCLKCHDSNGAVSTSARVPVSVMPNSSAAKPFGTTIAGAAYVGVGVTALGTLGGVADVNESFKTTNSSYHPVTGKQNNWYAKLTRMAAPWNTATRGATADVTSWGPLISCWDCHAPTGTTNTAILTGTVTAHGGPATVRGNATTNSTTPTATAAVTLCQYCHALYVSGSNHGANSAFTSQGNSGMGKWLQYGCNACHSSGYPTMAVRPARAQDSHGVNALPTGGKVATGRWSTGTDKRPYAFLRNTVLFTNHAPASISGTTYTATCSASSGGTPSVSCQAGSYTVGGTY
jgi:predicted CxxxxCH...CXXCH cytochrome family protein